MLHRKIEVEVMKNDLYREGNRDVALDDIVLDVKTTDKISKFLREYEHLEILRPYHLPINTKLLFYGPSGCGKTLMAHALANELGCDIIVINLTTIVSARLGETARNISTLFQRAAKRKSILFLDEFDSLGAMRNKDSKESGEMRRVVNTLIQSMDYLEKDTIMIAATNQMTLLDDALLRRFQLKICFTAPDKQLLDAYYDKMLRQYPASCQHIERLYEVSYAEAKTILIDQVKETLINEALGKMPNETNDSH